MNEEDKLIFEAYLLNEMPYNHDVSTNNTIDNNDKNLNEADRIRNDEDHEHIGKFNGLDIYMLDLNFGSYYLYLIGRHYIELQYYFREVDNDFVQTRGAYQRKESRGLMQDFFINYILPKYKNVMSDDSLSELAMGFWLKVITKLSNRIEFGVVDWDNEFNELTDVTDLRDFHHKGRGASDYKFYIKYFG
jgi:hypothetical protein